MSVETIHNETSQKAQAPVGCVWGFLIFGFKATGYVFQIDSSYVITERQYLILSFKLVYL